MYKGLGDLTLPPLTQSRRACKRLQYTDKDKPSRLFATWRLRHSRILTIEISLSRSFNPQALALVSCIGSILCRYADPRHLNLPSLLLVLPGTLAHVPSPSI